MDFNQKHITASHFISIKTYQPLVMLWARPSLALNSYVYISESIKYKKKNSRK